MSASLWAEAPMDLDSPFLKTALVRESNGQIIEKAVRKGRLRSGLIELEKAEGGLLILPSDQLLAVLPQFPQAGTNYLQSDAQRAFTVLTQAQKIYPERAEVAPSVLIEWEKLSRQTTEADQVEQKKLEKWFQSVTEVSPEVKTEEIRVLVEQGEGFAEKFPDQQKRISEQVRGLKEISKIDLSKTTNLSFPIGPFGDNFVLGAILWAILLIPTILIIHGISGTIQGFQERLPLAALLRLVVALLAGSFLVLVFWPDLKPRVNDTKGPQSVAQRALWFSQNMVNAWADQPAHRINMPLEAWEGLLTGKLEPGVEDLSSLLWYLDTPTFTSANEQFCILQPLVMKIVPVTLKFTFAIPEKGQSWTDAQLIGFQIGRLPLGKLIGSFALQPIASAYEIVRSNCGLDKGVQWMVGEAGAFVVKIPPTRQKRPIAKESISARELAEVYDQGFGDVYEGKVISVEGDLIDVSSQMETMGLGTKLATQDRMDEFILEGVKEGPNRRYPLRVRCQFKSTATYFLDAKGDLYNSAPNPQNPSSDIPILRRRDGSTKLRISSGRVESKGTERRLITIYDCRQVEGYDGKQWIKIF